MTTTVSTPSPLGPTSVDKSAEAARAASESAAASTAEQRARWLTAIADALETFSEELISLAHEESALGVARLTAELSRTTSQLRMFAGAVIEGSYLEATIDLPDPTSQPPRPDLRRLLRAIGPIAVFSASNFPFAFSVAGGDTASALAAGCPVVVKGHSAHPQLSRRTAELVAEALASAGAPTGLFGHVEGRQSGVDLVRHPAIQAVGFTGSLAGGRALFDLAVSRPDPIPFYGELSAVNPVLITERALEERADELAAGLVDSFTLGAGQFCTSPGVVFIPARSDFPTRVASILRGVEPTPMLSAGIAAAFAGELGRLAMRQDVSIVCGNLVQEEGKGSPVVLSTTATAVLRDPATLLSECFGPSTLLVEYSDVRDAIDAIRAVGGSLTATVHSEPGEDLAAVISALTQTAGRVVFDGWPTGVTVGWAQHHGGPWPSSTSIHTSVGATALRRFLRPVAYQNAPEAALPVELHDANVLNIPRRVNGTLVPPRSSAS